jgi:histone H3/H4
MAAKKKPMMIVGTKMKERLKEHGDVNVAGDLVDAVNVVVDEKLKAAVRRCLANGRKTVRADDL